MDNPLNQPASKTNGCDDIAALARANYANHVAALDYRNALYLDHFGRGEFHCEEGLHWCRLGDGVFNVVYGAELGQAMDETVLMRVRGMSRLIDEEWQEPTRWFVSTGDCPRSLPDLLESEGWEYGYEWTELGRTLDNHNWKGNRATDPVIETIHDESGWKEWIQVQHAGYELQGALAEYLEDMAHAFITDERRRFTLYIARNVQKEPVGAAALFVHEQSAGIYMVATHPDHRSKGIASALMQRLMQDAQESGCGSCVLQSSDAARSMYRKLGFIHTGTTTIYRRQPPIIHKM